MNPLPTHRKAESAFVPCTMLTSQGDPCGKPGQVGLPPGVCAEHAIAVFRAVSKMITIRESA